MCIVNIAQFNIVNRKYSFSIQLNLKIISAISVHYEYLIRNSERKCSFFIQLNKKVFLLKWTMNSKL